jgi:hypothetical protein
MYLSASSATEILERLEGEPFEVGVAWREPGES